MTPSPLVGEGWGGGSRGRSEPPGRVRKRPCILSRPRTKPARSSNEASAIPERTRCRVPRVDLNPCGVSHGPSTGCRQPVAPGNPTNPSSPNEPNRRRRTNPTAGAERTRPPAPNEPNRRRRTNPTAGAERTQAPTPGDRSGIRSVLTVCWMERGAHGFWTIPGLVGMPRRGKRGNLRGTVWTRPGFITYNETLAFSPCPRSRLFHSP